MKSSTLAATSYTTHLFAYLVISVLVAVFCIAPRVHAATHAGDIDLMEMQLDHAEDVLSSMIPSGEVLGASTVASGEVLGASTSIEALQAQLEKAQATKEALEAKLATLESSGSNATSTLKQIEFLSTQRIPFYESKIKRLKSRIENFDTPKATTTKDRKFNEKTFKINMNGLSNIKEGRPAKIRWVDAAHADAATLILSKYSDGTEVLNTSVTPSDKLYEWADAKLGMYRVTLTGTKDGETVESTGLLRVIDPSTRNGDQLNLKASEEDPDATTFSLERDMKSDWTTVFAFDIDAADSKNDITVLQLPVKFAVDQGKVGALINAVRITIDGDTFDTYKTGRDGKNRLYTFTFSELDSSIDAGSRVTAEVQVEFKGLAPRFEGTRLTASVSPKGVKASSVSELRARAIHGTVTGATHTLRTSGAVLSLNDTSTSIKENAPDDLTDDQGIFTVKFDVTAFESDVWVNKTAMRGVAMGTAGANYLVRDSSGDTVTSGTATAALSATADTDGSRYVVHEGDTETFTLTVNYDPTTIGDFFQVQLHSLNFATTNTDPTTKQQALPATDYETDQLSI